MIHTIYLFLLTIFLISGMASPQAAEGATSYIDEHNRFILNGEPFFPLGLYVVQCTNGSYSAQLDEIANSPFDTLMNYACNQCGSDATDAQILDYLDQLELRNLKLIFALCQYFDGGQDDIDTITHKVNTFKTHPAVISWYLNDERDPAIYLTQLEERYEKIRELDDNHAVWSVHWNADWLIEEAHTTDIVGMDPYPIGNHPITLVKQMADDANKAGKPLWLVPQIFDWGDCYNKNDVDLSDPRAFTGWPPTWEEMRAMSYLAVNHGAKGLIYYSYFNIVDDSDYDTRWEEIKGVASEIKDLSPVFLSTFQTGEDDISCNNNNIDFKLMWNSNKYYLFAVNTDVPPEIIIDNSEATYEGDWLLTDLGDCYAYGCDFRRNTTPGDGETATWTPNITEAGYYRVYAKWTAVTGMATDAPYTIYYNGGSKEVRVNQQENRGRWNLLGTYPFAVGTSGAVVLSDEADGVVISDAVRWQLKEGDVASASFQINLEEKPVEFETLFEGGRQISVTDGKVTDDFGVYEVHVYYWEEPESDDVDTGGGGGGGSSGGGCFIATAAFGSYINPHVQVLRDFRDEYLLTNMPGRWFVNMYNTYGPFWADLLNAHPGCKPLVRLALMPVVGISYFVLNTSLATKLLTGFLLLGFIPICLLRIHGRSVISGRDLVT